MSKKFKLNFLLFVCAVSNISYYPIFVGSSIARFFVIGLWLLLGIISLKKIIFINRAEQNVLTLYGAFFAVSVLSLIMGNEGVFGNHFFSTITIAIVIFGAGNILGESFDKRDIEKICRGYLYVMIAIATFLCVFHLAGTDIYSVYYTYQSGKNEIAVLFMCALAIAMTVYRPKNGIGYLLQIYAIGIFIADILLLKCRSVMIAVLPMFVFLLFMKKGLSKRFRKLLILALIAIAAYLFINRGAWDILVNQFIYANRDSTSVDNLSSGRLDQIREGLLVFRENWLIGVGSRKTLDCLYFSLLANYGIFAFPIILLALAPVFWSVKQLLNKKKERSPLSVCFFFIALGMFIVSLFEELAPFGPGTRCYILWLLWGLLLGNNAKQAREAKKSALDLENKEEV